MFTMLQLPLITWVIISLTCSVLPFQTIWNDNWDDGLVKSSYSTATTTTTTSPPVEPLFDSTPCYLNHCDDSIIQTIRSGPEFIDKVRCHQLDTQCHCCLRSQLARSELDKLYHSIGSSLQRRSKPSSSSFSPNFSSDSSSSSNRTCKVLNCDDYQVKAIKSLDDPNVSECHSYGDTADGDCECCVMSHLKPISRGDRSSRLSPSSSSSRSRSSNNGTRNFLNSPFDLDSSFYDFFSPSPKSTSRSAYDASSPSSRFPSTSSSSDLFDVDCVHHSCNGPQVKAIKRLPSHIITCVKMGNSDGCKCCFNSSISIFERVKYEIELTDNIRSTNNNNRDPPSYKPLQPPSLSRRSSPSYSSSSYSPSLFQTNLECSLHHCESDLVQLIRSISTHVVECKPVDNFYSDKNHCRCCIDSSVSSAFNLRHFLRFLNF